MATETVNVDQHIAEWRQHAISTSTDRKMAEEYVVKIYREMKLKPPKEIIWVRSPAAGLYVVGHLLAGTAYPDPENSNVLEMFESVKDWAKVDEARSNIVYGCNDAGWLARIDYLHKCGRSTSFSEQAKPVVEYGKYAGWMFPYDTVCVCSDKPTEIHFDANWRLHNPTGPAYRYADGFAAFAWHGVDLPKEMIRQRETFTPDKILALPNAEQRRCGIEIYDYFRKTGAFIKDSGATKVHSDDWGTLWRIDKADMLFVEVLDSTPNPNTGIGDTYFLRVDTQLRPMTHDRSGTVQFGSPQAMTARNAVASTFGMTGEEYNPEVER